MRRAAVLFLACAGCDAVLGIHDVPVPDDADTDATSDVVLFDAIVTPDGAFDGCNGGAENCVNGLDDNCNDLIDCADPLCQENGFVCAAAVPAGWTGPVALAVSTNGTVPSCSGVYTGGPTGNAGLSAPAAQCGCMCPSQATNTQCDTSVTLTTYSGSGCTGGTISYPLTVGVCSSDISSVLGVKAVNDPPSSLGTCAATPSKTIAPPTWAHGYAVCAYTAPSGGGCGSGTCIEAPPNVFTPKPCIYQADDVACPGAPYTIKTTFTTALSDTRDCSLCTCTPSGGACTSSMTQWTGSGCSGSATAFSANGSCDAFSGYTSVEANAPTVTPASCTAAGGQATGSATASNPVTVCCQP